MNKVSSGIYMFLFLLDLCLHVCIFSFLQHTNWLGHSCSLLSITYVNHAWMWGCCSWEVTSSWSYMKLSTCLYLLSGWIPFWQMHEKLLAKHFLIGNSETETLLAFETSWRILSSALFWRRVVWLKFFCPKYMLINVGYDLKRQVLSVDTYDCSTEKPKQLIGRVFWVSIVLTPSFQVCL